MVENYSKNPPIIVSHGCVKSVILDFLGIKDINLDYGSSVYIDQLNTTPQIELIGEYDY